MDELVILNFHGIGEPDRPLETGEAGYWLTRETFSSILDEARKHPFIRLTFDDGNASDVRIALPALQERGMQAKFFVLAGRIGRAGSLSQADLHELEGAGMEIGSHGLDHKAWTTLSDSELQREVCDSKAIIEDHLGHGIAGAACPFGLYGRRVLRRLKEAGYHHVYTSDGGPARAGAWFQPRSSLKQTDTAHRVADVIAACHARPTAWLRQIKVLAKKCR